jgi:preprotein translocase subunit YajC
MRKVVRLISLLLAGLASLVLLSGCAPEGTSDTTSTVYMVVFLALLFAIFYFLIIRPQRRRQKRQQDLMSEIRTGDRVITIGGIYGQIDSLREDSAVLKIESGAMIRISRNSIAAKQSEIL